MLLFVSSIVENSHVKVDFAEEERKGDRKKRKRLKLVH